jgi:hypothetical protein
MNSKRQTFSLFKLAVLILDSLVGVAVLKMMTYFVTLNIEDQFLEKARKMYD